MTWLGLTQRTERFVAVVKRYELAIINLRETLLQRINGSECAGRA
jgi:hypothetical protein